MITSSGSDTGGSDDGKAEEAKRRSKEITGNDGLMETATCRILSHGRLSHGRRGCIELMIYLIETATRRILYYMRISIQHIQSLNSFYSPQSGKKGVAYIACCSNKRFLGAVKFLGFALWLLIQTALVQNGMTVKRETCACACKCL